MADDACDGNTPPTASVPLRCDICTKKPSFSDISHLLTHIGSKGHLSTYYKLKIRAAQDVGAQKLIDDYDSWYAVWNIEDRMSARLRGREKNSRRHNRSMTKSRGFVDRERVHVNEFEHSHHTTGQASAYTVKSEELTPTMTSYMLPSMVYNPFASYASPYTPYGGISFAYGSLPKAAFPDPDQADARTESYIWSDESLPADPADLPLTPSSPPARHLGPSLDSLGDPSKLKGVFWPGMDLFDAATNEMKRQRNQKKAASATERLELMSQQVEATECKFNADVTLIREREITGFPNSDSINGDDVPTPARKKRKPAVRKTAASTKVTATSERLPRSKARRRIKADDVGSRGPQIFVPYGAKTDAVIDTSRRGKDAVKKKRKSRAAKRKTSHLDQASIASLTESLETIDPRHVNTATDMFYDGPVESIENNDGFAAEPCSPKPWRNEWGYAQYGDHVSAYSYDHVGSALMNWYAQEQDQGGVVPNPLYMPNDTFYVSDDDQRTISAPASEA